MLTIQSIAQSLDTEMHTHWTRVKQVLADGEKLQSSVPPATKKELGTRLQGLQSAWDELKHLSAQLAHYLKEAQQAQQYFQDANEAESWIREKMPLVCSDDFGKDERSAGSLLARHTHLQEEINSYK